MTAPGRWQPSVGSLFHCSPDPGFAAPGHRSGWRPETYPRPGRGCASPVPTMAVPPFHAPYADGFFGAAPPSASPLPWPSPFTTRQASLHATDWWLHPPEGELDPALQRSHLSLNVGGLLRGGLVPPLAGLAPASCRRVCTGRTLFHCYSNPNLARLPRVHARDGQGYLDAQTGGSSHWGVPP